MASRMHSILINGGRPEKGHDRHPFGRISSMPPERKAKAWGSGFARRNCGQGSRGQRYRTDSGMVRPARPRSALAQSRSSGGPTGGRGNSPRNCRNFPFSPGANRSHAIAGQIPLAIASSRRRRAPPVVDLCPFLAPRPFTMMECVQSPAIHMPTPRQSLSGAERLAALPKPSTRDVESVCEASWPLDWSSS
jgi:hypothetical protein